MLIYYRPAACSANTYSIGFASFITSAAALLWFSDENKREYIGPYSNYSLIHHERLRQAMIKRLVTRTVHLKALSA